MTTIINNRLRNTITFQDEIHGFRKERGTGTAILYNKLLCQQSNMEGNVDSDLFQSLMKALNSSGRRKQKTISNILHEWYDDCFGGGDDVSYQQ